MSINISIAPAVLHSFPETKIAVALVRGRVVDTFRLKKGPVATFLSELKQDVVRNLIQKGIGSDTYMQQPVCQSWERVFRTFDVEDRHATIVNLLRKAAAEADKVKKSQEPGNKPQKADLGKISDIVDLYNSVSLETLTPMGVIRVDAIKGDIEVRYGKDGEKFTPLGRVREVIDVLPKHIVYADKDSILSWLWNYRDAKHSAIPNETKDEIDVLIFADQAEKDAGNVELAIKTLISKIDKIQWKVLGNAVLDASCPQVTMTVPMTVPNLAEDLEKLSLAEKK